MSVITIASLGSAWPRPTLVPRTPSEEPARGAERWETDLIAAASDAIVSWTVDGEIVSWNPAAERLYGVPRDRALGRSIDRIVPELLREELRVDERRLLAGERLPARSTVRLRGAQKIDVEDSRFLIAGDDDGGRGFASIARGRSDVPGPGATADLDRPHTTVMQDVLEAAELVAKDGIAAVMLLGETGVGKGWLARRIHETSPRAARPYVEINCASLSPQLVESELFGHERGAFTGATAMTRGLVEAADGGTLFLDEVAELPLAVQAKLLTFLDERRFRRVGGTRVMSVDVRLIAATNVDLLSRVRRGEFRKDLFYRLSVVPLSVPPLRERRDEIRGLAQTILSELATRSPRRAGADLGEGVLEALDAHDWPGNVRELRNVLERAIILSGGGSIQLRHLPADLRRPGRDPGSPITSVPLAALERSHILRLLTSVGGNRTRAAERLGIGRSTLKRKLAEMTREGIAVPSPAME